MNYYNEWDKGAAAWLRELIKAGLIPNGYVDDRSITDVTPSDLEGFTQCHFFAGIGGWSYALQLAGIPASTRLWTGSPPCQPFSVAGKQLGQLDERHLAPTFMRLVDQCRPAILFGEQVAAAIGKHWLDDLFAELERQGYACGAAVLPAASVGSPHKRDRLFFGAINGLAYPGCFGDNERDKCSELQGRKDEAKQNGMGGSFSSMADTNDARPQGWGGVPERADQQPAWAAGLAGGMADADGRQSGNRKIQCGGEHRQQPEDSGIVREGIRGEWSSNDANAANPHHGFWSDADWLGCRDGKFRPVESGTFPLADGVPARVGRLRGYGNAIVPQVAAEFIKAFTGAVVETETYSQKPAKRTRRSQLNKI